MKALITGATGLVGRHLLRHLEGAHVLSRDPAAAGRKLAEFGVRVFPWDPIRESPPPAAFDGVDVVFHLAGESIANGRWTRRKKRRLRESRLEGTRNLIQAMAVCDAPPTTVISASAVGYYGDGGDDYLTESSGAGAGFLAELCSDWETQAMEATAMGTRVVTPRIGIVLGRDGGVLAKMLPLFRYGLASPLGSGRQWMPWIHIEDLVSLLLTAAADDRYIGPFNATSPRPVTNREFTFTLGRVLGRPTFLPAVPRSVLRIGLGQFSQVLLTSQRVVPEAALAAGFKFAFPELESAFRDLLDSPAATPSGTAGTE